MSKVILVYGGYGNRLFQYQKAIDISLTELQSISIDLINGELRFWKNGKSVKQNIISKSIIVAIDLARRLLRRLARSYSDDYVYFGFIYDGYWQNVSNDKNFDNLLDSEILHLNPLPEYKNTLFIHIRGGDYLTAVNSKIYVKLCADYYQRSLELFEDDLSIAVVTNDNHYAEEIVADLEHSVRSRIIWPNESPLDLMYSCKGGVCANSTFSWWVAAVGKGVYVLPRHWFVDKTSGINKRFKRNIWVL
jgi:hypothetical protein